MERLFHLFHEHFCGLESGDFVLRDDDGGVLGDVAGGLFRACLYDERTKATEIYVFTMGKRVLHNFHELFNSSKNSGLFNTGGLGNLVYDVSFSHFIKLFNIVIKYFDLHRLNTQVRHLRILQVQISYFFCN